MQDICVTVLVSKATAYPQGPCLINNIKKGLIVHSFSHEFRNRMLRRMGFNLVQNRKNVSKQEANV